MTDILSTKEVVQSATLRIPKGMKNAISISITVSNHILIKIENIISEEYKTKNRLK